MVFSKSTATVIAVVAVGGGASSERPSSKPQSSGAKPAAALFNPDNTLVFLKPCTFRRVWVAIVLSHLLCAAFVAFFGMVYLYLRHCIVMNAVSVYGIAIDVKYFPNVALMYFALVGIHVLLVSDILVRSIRARALVLRKVTPEIDSEQQTATYSRPVRMIRAATSRALQQTSAFTPKPVSKAVGLVWRVIVVCRGAMSVRSKDYELFFLARELWQTTLQSYQAYRLSGLLPRLWMNNGIVALLVFNCWSTPLMKYVYPKHNGKLRLSCVLISVGLDFASHAAIPIALLLPYLQQFNFDKGDFDLVYWYTDVWFAEAINEIQLLFVTSFWDVLSKFMVAMSVARWLDTITKLVRVTRPDGSRHSSIVSIAPSDVDFVEERAKDSRHAASWKSRAEKGGQRLMIVWGFVVLVTHLHAASVANYPQCLLRTRPWFGRKPTCSLLAFDCSQENSTGSAQDFDTFLQIFDEAKIQFLVIGKCPLFEFPPRFNTLNQLLGMKIFQTTILRWDSTAALTNKHHPEFLTIFFVDVNATELPQGLLDVDLPQKFMDIEFVRTNLTRLPDAVATIWPKGMFLILENCQFQEFPSVVLLMEPRYLSLAANNISSLPAQILVPVSPVMLFLAGNPIAELPSGLASAPQVGWLNVVSTQMSYLPDWIDESYLAGAIVEAGGTPLCDRMVKLGLASATDQLAQLGIPGLDCSTARIESEGLGWYPAGDEEDRNPSYIKEDL